MTMCDGLGDRKNEAIPLCFPKHFTAGQGGDITALK